MPGLDYRTIFLANEQRAGIERAEQRSRALDKDRQWQAIADRSNKDVETIEAMKQATFDRQLKVAELASRQAQQLGQDQPKYGNELIQQAGQLGFQGAKAEARKAAAELESKMAFQGVKDAASLKRTRYSADQPQIGQNLRQSRREAFKRKNLFPHQIEQDKIRARGQAASGGGLKQLMASMGTIPKAGAKFLGQEYSAGERGRKRWEAPDEDGRKVMLALTSMSDSLREDILRGNTANEKRKREAMEILGAPNVPISEKVALIRELENEGMIPISSAGETSETTPQDLIKPETRKALGIK